MIVSLIVTFILITQSNEIALKESYCHYSKNTCICCEHIQLKQIKLNGTACFILNYLPDEYGFDLQFTVNNHTLIDEKISARNPPPVCAIIPYIPHTSICLQLKNITIIKKHIHVCLVIEGHLEHVLVEKLKLGCVDIPFMHQTKSNIFLQIFGYLSSITSIESNFLIIKNFLKLLTNKLIKS